MNIKVLIIGPEDTPYEKGFFFFDFIMPDNYPFAPPKVKFCTLDPNVRFNPNLYVDGKVCLSIINTWSGPSWTSAQTLSSVLLSIQSILNEFPLRNEPGFENEKDERCQIYSDIIKHETFRVAVKNVLNNIPVTFETFVPIVNDYFMNNISWYMAKLEELSSKFEKKILYSPIYSMKLVCNYKNIRKELVTYYTNICPKDKLLDFKSIDQNIEELEKNESVENKEIKKKKVRTPSKLAKKYPEGYSTISDRDKDMIYTVICDKNGIKKWKLNNKLNKNDISENCEIEISI